MLNLSNINKFCICLKDDINRVNHVNNYMISIFNDIEIVYVNKQASFNSIYKDLNFQFPGQLGCAMSHYDVIFNAYHNGNQYLMVCEDDIEFNINDIQLFLNNAPNDFDILQFYALDNKLPSENQLNKNDLEKKYINKIFWYKVNNKCQRYGTVFYILNRNGMKYYLARQNEYLRIADYPFLISYLYDINHYIPTIKLINETGFNTTVFTNKC